MVDMYCANHADCLFYKHWREQIKNAESLRHITGEMTKLGFFYNCRAKSYCESSADNAEKFLASLSPPVNFDNNCRSDSGPDPIPRECSVITTLNLLEELLREAKAGKK